MKRTNLARLAGALNCFLVLGGVFLYAEEGAFDVEGRVLNLTASDEGAPLADAPVLLQRHDWTSMEDISETHREEGITDEEGRFAFRDLEFDHHTFFTVATEYQGVRYLTDPIVPPAPPEAREEGAGEDAPEAEDLVLAVYESKPGTPQLHAHVRHVFASVEGGAVHVRDMMAFMNPERYTFLGDDAEPTLRLTLPEGAAQIAVREGLPGVHVSENVVESHVPIRPGMLDVVADYIVPRSKELVIPVDFPTQMVGVLVAGKGVRPSGPELSEAEEVEFEGVKYLHVQAHDLAPGQPLVVHLKARWTPEKKLRAGALAGAIIIALAVAWTLFRMRKAGPPAASPPAAPPPAASPPAAPHPAASPTPAGSEKEALLEALADLDERRDKGEISPEAHARERAALKERLMRMMQGKGGG
ncbi:MAG: hypothetical protein JSV08_10175 [Acidobacteriota bacterium]|nr:MAG: hypothetical protein JSV08_10175 [Acidobacteriota bacterium]